MLPYKLLSLAAFLCWNANAQLTLTGTNSITEGEGTSVPSGSYKSYSTTITVSTTGSLASTSNVASNMGSSNATHTTTSASETLIGGTAASTAFTVIPTTYANGTIGNVTIASNGTARASSVTTTSAQPTNTQPCNNYPELCTRKYSNVTEVCAHNSPFVRANNAASNQELPVLDQLNDGIRMLQGQAHKVNGSMHWCHTSCDILDSGTLVDYFTTVAGWVRTHPYDVVTILIGNGLGNSDVWDVTNFTGPLIDSGLTKYTYEPPQIPMGLDAWPTLGEMILSGKRAVVFLDYEANQTAVPYILDQFSQMFETPFSPTNQDFPCTAQRPPGATEKQYKDKLYLANHNLNTDISLLGASVLVPNTVYINQTNSASGYGSLGVASTNCTAKWDRPPNFLLVDYYNRGSTPGSVFEVAAAANGVTYNRKCCGLVKSASPKILAPSFSNIAVLFLTALLFLSSW